MTAIRSCCAWCGAGNVRHGGASRSSASGPRRWQYSLTSSAYWSCHGEESEICGAHQQTDHFDLWKLMKTSLYCAECFGWNSRERSPLSLPVADHAGCPCCDGNLAGASLEARFSALSRKTIRVVWCTVHNLARSLCLCNPNWVPFIFRAKSFQNLLSVADS